MNVICSWSHGVVTMAQLMDHQICGACAGDEPFYIVRDGVTEKTVRCKYCPDAFQDHKLRSRFWKDQEYDYNARLECSVEDCPCNRFIVHDDDAPTEKEIAGI